MIKNATADENTLRVPNLSATHPLTGINTAKAITYEVMPVLICITSVPNEAAIVGIAVLTAVVSRNCMKNAIATIKDTVRDLWCFSCIVVISFAPIKKTCAK